MPMYFFTCPGCNSETRTILSVQKSKEPQLCKKCGVELKRTPKPPSSQIVERLDNGQMTRAVERLAEAPRLFHEHTKGKKTAV